MPQITGGGIGGSKETLEDLLRRQHADARMAQTRARAPQVHEQIQRDRSPNTVKHMARELNPDDGGFSLGGALMAGLHGVSDFSTGMVGDVKDFGVGAYDSARDLVEGGWSGLSEDIQNLPNDLGEMGNAYLEGIPTSLDELIDSANQDPLWFTLSGIGGVSGVAGRAASLADNAASAGRSALDQPSTAAGIESRLSVGQEAAAQNDFARNLQALADENRAQYGVEEPPGTGLYDAYADPMHGARNEWEPRDPDAYEPMPSYIEDIAKRFLDEERGGNVGPDPAGRPGEWLDEQLGAYRKNRQPDLKGDIEFRTPADLSPEGQNIRDMLEQSGWSEESMQAPTLEGMVTEALQRARQEKMGNVRALMEGVDNTGHNTKMNAQGGSGVTNIRQGRRIGGESQQYAPFDREVEAPGSKPRTGPRKMWDDLNPDVNRIPDDDRPPQMNSYEAAVGIRDLLPPSEFLPKQTQDLIDEILSTLERLGLIEGDLAGYGRFVPEGYRPDPGGARRNFMERGVPKNYSGPRPV